MTARRAMSGGFACVSTIFQSVGVVWKRKYRRGVAKVDADGAFTRTVLADGPQRIDGELATTRGVHDEIRRKGFNRFVAHSRAPYRGHAATNDIGIHANHLHILSNRHVRLQQRAPAQRRFDHWSGHRVTGHAEIALRHGAEIRPFFAHIAIHVQRNRPCPKEIIADAGIDFGERGLAADQQSMSVPTL